MRLIRSCASNPKHASHGSALITTRHASEGTFALPESQSESVLIKTGDKGVARFDLVFPELLSDEDAVIEGHVRFEYGIDQAHADRIKYLDRTVIVAWPMCCEQLINHSVEIVILAYDSSG